MADRADRQLNVGDRNRGTAHHEVIMGLEVTKVEDVRKQWHWMYFVSNPYSYAELLDHQVPKLTTNLAFNQLMKI
jgi:hypothetical protein